MQITSIHIIYGLVNTYIKRVLKTWMTMTNSRFRAIITSVGKYGGEQDRREAHTGLRLRL